MVKLIRLKGQAKAGNVGSEINNNFSSSIFVQPKSRLALRSVQVELSQVREFNVPSNTIFNYRINGGQGDAFTEVSVPAIGDQQSLNPIVQEMQVAANSTAPPVSTQDKYHGSYHIYDIHDEKVRLRSYQAEDKNAGYDQWEDDIGGSALTKTADTLSSDGTAEVVTFLTHVVPLVSNTVKFTLTNVGSMVWAHTEYNDSDNEVYGINITATGVGLIVNNSQVAFRGIAPVAGDQYELKKLGTGITLTVRNAAGAVLYTLDGTLNNTYIQSQALYNVIKIPNGETTAISSGADALQALDIDPENPQGDGRAHSFRVKFPSINGNAFLTLGPTLGFDPDTDYDNTGAPAEIIAVRVSNGTELQGVLVAIDGLDLDTYIGATNQVIGNVNILDVLKLDSNSVNNTIDYQSNFPVPLDLKNDREAIIRNLRVRFLDNNLNVLKYRGQPVVILELYGPDEST